MISPRAETILNLIVSKYIDRAVPVPSQSIAQESALGVSSATIRNEMARLEQEGYILRAHHSAGGVPSNKGYRFHVESLKDISLSESEQRLFSHVFHQVERDLEKWLSLAATLLAQQAQNIAMVTTPKPAGCRFKHMELLSLQDTLALIVLVLHGARVKEQLITFDEAIPQSSLTVMSNKLNAAFSGMNREQIAEKEIGLSPAEEQIKQILSNIMQQEDEQEYEEPYLDGFHFMLSQPEFSQSERVRSLMELVEKRHLIKTILPKEVASQKVTVIIGTENRNEALHEYSIVISRYGILNEVVGTVGVLGPTRMPYAHTIPTVNYLSKILSELMSGLY
ncbi:MAG TPA: heat-inducible transcription repressor HrcA [Dehalococcoidia bacterium]|nr:heat-inducible transcription repressor HrcA [Dehalococcoidia bacterium]